MTREQASIERILRQGPLVATERRILLAHALQISRIELVSQSQRVLAHGEWQRYQDLVARRAAGEPIAYLVGAREFYGRSFAVSEAVLIPRPETELLVELALAYLPSRAGVRILDLGTGSGALGITLALERRDAQVELVELSPGALAIASANAARLGAAVTLTQSDWYGALRPGLRDLIVANPPYVAAGDSHLAEGDLRFEPQQALSDGGDGLSALRQVITGAPERLAPGAWLILEHGFDQAAAVRALLVAAGLVEVSTWGDLAGHERASGARAAL